MRIFTTNQHEPARTATRYVLKVRVVRGKIKKNYFVGVML
jgi:hypothetical protein